MSLNEPAYCPRCGQPDPSTNLDCRCTAVHGTLDQKAAILEAATAGDPHAKRQVVELRDPGLREALEAVVADQTVSDTNLIQALFGAGTFGDALYALGTIASPASYDFLADLADRERLPAPSYIRYLARLGTRQAFDRLIDLIDASPRDAYDAIVATGDQRALEAMCERANAGDEEALAGFARLRSDTWNARLGPELRQRVEDWWRPRLPDGTLVEWPPPLTPVASDRSVVPAWQLDYEPGDETHPGTRFGGQPTWRGDPTWPSTSAGTPMAFWAQFEVPWAPEDMAYLFVDPRDGSATSDDGFSFFVQPGGRPLGPFTDAARGPVLPDRADHQGRFRSPEPYGFDARVPSLTPFTEPEEWRRGDEIEQRSWDKLGGTAIAVQGVPDAGGAEFLGEFTAQLAGHEIADGAHFYLFVDRDTRSGIVHWDCH